MALEVWYRPDIQNALRAAEHAGEMSLRAVAHVPDAFATGYQTGYRAALTTLALAFGLLPVGSTVIDWSMSGADVRRLVDGETEIETVREEA